MAEAPEWRIVLTSTPDPDRFTIIDEGGLAGGKVTFGVWPTAASRRFS
jgi:hypothetical protein